MGISQRSVSWSEQQGNNVPDSTIKSICMAFNVNEEWLRTGKEPMYVQEPSFNLDKFVKEHGGTDLELEALKAYFELDPDIRKMLVKHFKERLNASYNELTKPTMTMKETEAECNKKNLEELSDEEQIELYRQELKREREVKEKSKALRKSG